MFVVYTNGQHTQLFVLYNLYTPLKGDSLKCREISCLLQNVYILTYYIVLTVSKQFAMCKNSTTGIVLIEMVRSNNDVLHVLSRK
jgi:hypothetical protein